MRSFTSAVRKSARQTYIRSLLGIEPIWRYALNLGPTLQYRRWHPALNDEGARVLAELNTNGVAQSTLTALTGNPGLLRSLQEYAAGLEQGKAAVVAEQAAALADAELGNGAVEKKFVVTLLDPDRPVIDPLGVLAEVTLNQQIKAIADNYYRMRTLATDINIWRNLPTGQGPVASQLWHRDLPGDYLILKMFVYLEDVVEGGGPYSYIKGTHAKGRRNWHPKATYDGYNWRATDADIEAETTPGERPRYVGPAGTVLFTDTTGWHKGGHAVTDSRLVLQVLFASRGALPDRMLGAPADLDLTTAPPDLKYDTKTITGAGV